MHSELGDPGIEQKAASGPTILGPFPLFASLQSSYPSLLTPCLPAGRDFYQSHWKNILNEGRAIMPHLTMEVGPTNLPPAAPLLPPYGCTGQHKLTRQGAHQPPSGNAGAALASTAPQRQSPYCSGPRAACQAVF